MPAGEKTRVNGKTFSSFLAACNYHKIPFYVAFRRKREGWKLAEIFNTPYKKRERKVKVDGVSYPSIKDAIEAYGWENHRIVRNRITKGWSIEDAVLTEQLRYHN